MKIADHFHDLIIPQRDEGILSALRLPNTNSCRIAKDKEGQPVLLFALSAETQGLRLRSYRLKYLELIHNLKCTITESGSIADHVFTLVRFTSKVRHMQEYFLQYAESLVQIIENNPTATQFAESISNLVEIFSALSLAPTKSIQGLWAELFVISNSRNPEALLDFWHARPEEKFDFSSGFEMLEVKSTSSLERAHYFSNEQLNPASGSQALIASLIVRQSSNGWSVQQLINNISAKLNDNFELISKLNLVAANTLGTSLEETVEIKLDYSTAKESMQFYSTNNIPRISQEQIPKEISDVKYKCSLKAANATDLDELPNKGRLFSAI